jgi:hypothetical protein
MFIIAEMNGDNGSSCSETAEIMANQSDDLIPLADAFPINPTSKIGRHKVRTVSEMRDITQKYDSYDKSSLARLHFRKLFILFCPIKILNLVL